MIVKDEAASMAAVLDAALPFVDQCTILDTGSTDGTQDIVREVAARHGKPWQLFEEPFVDFAVSRNRVMELDALCAAPALFQFMVSADEYLEGGEALRAHLETHRATNVDCHMVRVTVEGQATALAPRVLRTGSPWRYVGVVHETPKHPDAMAPVEIARGVLLRHVVSDSERRIRNIADKHIPLLEEELNRNPRDERTLVFLAQSYAAIMPYVEPEERLTLAMQAMSMYMRRLNIPTGTEAERNFCMEQFLDAARVAQVYTPQELYERVRRQCEVDPHRPGLALLHALTAAAANVDLRKVYKLARLAIEVAIAAQHIDNVSVIDVGGVWRAQEFAAHVARLIAERAPKDRWQGMLYEDLAKEHDRDAEHAKQQVGAN
jgi:hypothetical protein